MGVILVCTGIIVTVAIIGGHATKKALNEWTELVWGEFYEY